MLQLQIETNSTCNAACRFCIYPVVEESRRGKLMSMDLYSKIVREAATFTSITFLTLNGLSEPLLDPKLAERIKMARDLRPDWFIYFHTNGVYLTSDRFRALQDAGTSFVSVSVNALNAEQHEKAMGLVGKYDKVCNNLTDAIANSETTDVECTAIMDIDNFTEEDARNFLRKWGDRRTNGRGKCVYVGNWSGDMLARRPFKANECCERAVKQIYVMYDGRVTACCFDPTGKMIFGDLNKQTLAEVYSSAEYLGFRLDHSENRADAYDICKNCTRI